MTFLQRLDAKLEDYRERCIQFNAIPHLMICLNGDDKEAFIVVPNGTSKEDIKLALSYVWGTLHDGTADTSAIDSKLEDRDWKPQ